MKQMVLMIFATDNQSPWNTLKEAWSNAGFLGTWNKTNWHRTKGDTDYNAVIRHRPSPTQQWTNMIVKAVMWCHCCAFKSTRQLVVRYCGVLEYTNSKKVLCHMQGIKKSSKIILFFTYCLVSSDLFSNPFQLSIWKHDWWFEWYPLFFFRPLSYVFCEGSWWLHELQSSFTS